MVDDRLIRTIGQWLYEELNRAVDPDTTDSQIADMSRQLTERARDQYPRATEREIHAAVMIMAERNKTDERAAELALRILAKAIEATGNEDITTQEAVELLGYDDPGVDALMKCLIEMQMAFPKGSA